MRALAILAAAALGLGVPAAYAPPTPSVRLDSAAGSRIDGLAAGDEAGTSVAGVGDQNGDGRPGIAVGAPGRAGGSVYVGGFTIRGTGTQQAGWSLAGPGDFSGDGQPDIAIGLGLDSAYVVYGRPGADVDLANIGTRGFKIQAEPNVANLGTVVAPAGDVNGDGKADLVVSDGRAEFKGGHVVPNKATVIWGKSDLQVVTLHDLGGRGFLIDGANIGAEFSVSAAGDVNGDGKADVMLGAPFAGANGAVFVVYGKADTFTVDVGSLAGKGFRIDGAPGDHAGSAVAPAGDVNGDGRGDLLIGASGTGSAYVVFGQASPGNVALGSLGVGGFRISGTGIGDAVAGIGDTTGDGRADLLLGAPASAAAYLVYGSASVASVDLSAPGDRGVKFVGDPGDRTGFSVAGAGDVNGDGRPDFAVGAPGADPGGRVDAGSAFVVTGVATPPPPPPPPPAPPPPHRSRRPSRNRSPRSARRATTGCTGSAGRSRSSRR